jgi:hypothetical protein
MNKNLILIIIALIIIIVLSASISKTEEFDDPMKPVLTLYYTDWCHYSQLFLKEWKKIEHSILREKTTLVKYDCDKNSDKCKNITGYPTIVLYKNGSELHFPQTMERTAINVIEFFNNYV